MTTVTTFRPETEFLTPERCHIVEMFNRADDSACSIARARVESGVSTQTHSLQGITERYVILNGKGMAEIGGQPAIEVGPLDVVQIPAGVSQRITNNGKTDLVFLCVCTPRFKPEAYQHKEDK